jgi:hypothetical protein
MHRRPQPGHCITPELARELATVDLDQLRRKVSEAAEPLRKAAVEFLRARGGA